MQEINEGTTEKGEEFGNIHKKQAWALDFMQEGLKFKQKAKVKVLRIREDLEGATHKLKVTLDHTNNHCCHLGTFLRKWYVKHTFLPKTLILGIYFI